MKLNIQNKLLLPILTILLLFMGSSAFLLAHIIVKQIETHTIDMLRAGNEILVKNIHSAMVSYKSSVHAMATMPQLRLAAEFYSDTPPAMGTKNQAIEQVQSLLETLPISYPAFVQLNFATSDGTVVASSNRKTVGNVNIRDRDYFKTVMNGGETISSPLMSKSVGEKAVIVASPVKNTLGNVRGVMYAILPCRWVVSDTIEGVRMGKTGYAYIVDGGSGLMLAHQIFEKVQTMNMYEYQPWMRDLKDGESGTKADYRDSNGNHRLAVYYKEPVSGWIAVSCIATEELEAQAAIIRNIILALTIGSTLLVAVIHVHVIRSVTHDVQETNQYAQAVADGELDRRLDVHRDDELGALGNALQRMVASLKRMLQASDEQNRYFREATRHMYNSIYEIDITGDRFAPESMLHQFKSLDVGERSYSESVMLFAKHIIRNDFQDVFLSSFSRDNILKDYAEGKTHICLDCPTLQTDGYQWLRYDAQIFSVEQDKTVHIYLYSRDINTEVENERKARTDALTGCLTRGALEQMAEKYLMNYPDTPHAFFIIDIDNFKQANDRFGHAFGDYCIRQFATGIRHNFRANDMIGRIGGDEFVVFIQTDNMDWIYKKATDLVQSLNIDCELEGNIFHLSASIGVAMSKQGVADYATLYHNADEALYAAKDAGKNGFKIFSENVHDKSSEA